MPCQSSANSVRTVRDVMTWATPGPRLTKGQGALAAATTPEAATKNAVRSIPRRAGTNQERFTERELACHLHVCRHLLVGLRPPSFTWGRAFFVASRPPHHLTV